MESISLEQADIIGEIANICIGTAATALSMIINRPTNITTPKVEVLTKEALLGNDDTILIKVPYTKGLDGTNLMVLDRHDALIIANLMMGGDGTSIYTIRNLRGNEPDVWFHRNFDGIPVAPAYGHWFPTNQLYRTKNL